MKRKTLPIILNGILFYIFKTKFNKFLDLKDTIQDENNEKHIKKVVCLLKEVLTSNNENHPNRFLKEVCFFL